MLYILVDKNNGRDKKPKFKINISFTATASMFSFILL